VSGALRAKITGGEFGKARSDTVKMKALTRKPSTSREASNRAGTLSIAESHMPRSWQRVKGLLHGQAPGDSVLEKGPLTSPSHAIPELTRLGNQNVVLALAMQR